MAVPEQFLHGPNVVAIFQQMGGKRVSKAVATCGLVNPRADPSFLYGFLKNRLVQMVPAALASCRVS
jgi:hypothetical protein